MNDLLMRKTQTKMPKNNNLCIKIMNLCRILSSLNCSTRLFSEEIIKIRQHFKHNNFLCLNYYA